MTRESNPSSRRRPRWWPWHQRLGLIFSGVFVVVILTGIGLNHTGGLKLDQRFITYAWLLDWYGMEPKGKPTAYQAEGWAISWDRHLYWGGELIDPEGGPLRGAIALSDVRSVATSDALYLLTRSGALIERIEPPFLPPGTIQRIGQLSNRLIVLTSGGTYRGDLDGGTWDEIEPTDEVVWSTSENLPEAERDAVLQAYRGQGVSVYRVMLDLHSGRLFGELGVWVVDASAVVLLFLVGTGVWYALRVKRR